MAILTHEVDGNTASFTSELAYGGTYTVLEQSATGDDGVIVYTVTEDDLVDTINPGLYEVYYTATDDGGVPGSNTITNHITVLAPTGVVDTPFDLGLVGRDGRDLSGTTYHSSVAGVISGTPAKPAQSAYFSETALDPYEVKYS